MILQIFTIHDKKAEAYLPPFYLPQTGQAIRTFSDCVNDPEHQFSLHPGDYTLLSIGSWDDKTAIAMSTAPESLGNGLEFVETEYNKQWDLLSEEEQNAELKGFAKDHGENPDLFESKKGNSK